MMFKMIFPLATARRDVIYLERMKGKKMSQRNQILSIIIGTLFIFILVFGAFLYGRSTNSQSLQTQKRKEDLVIKTQVQTAVSILNALYQKQQKGDFTTEESMKLGADILRELRYGPDNSGYFWADTTDGTNVVLYGNSEVEGTNRWDSYVGGIYHVREIIKNGMKEGGGYTDYYFPKKGDTIPVPKRGYSLLFSPFDWVIGSGYYLEDLK